MVSQFYLFPFLLNVELEIVGNDRLVSVVVVAFVVSHGRLAHFVDAENVK